MNSQKIYKIYEFVVEARRAETEQKVLFSLISHPFLME